LTRAERGRAELFEEGRLKRTASTRGRVRVDDADPDPESSVWAISIGSLRSESFEITMATLQSR